MLSIPYASVLSANGLETSATSHCHAIISPQQPYGKEKPSSRERQKNRKKKKRITGEKLNNARRRIG